MSLDACGGPGGDGVDTELLAFLADEAVPATLFVNARWIEANSDVFDELVAEPRFEIANHGTEHRPLSVEGRSAYGIAGTASPEEVVAEVAGAQRRIAEATGLAPRHFRSGTAHDDDVALRIVRDLGLECVNYDVLGDASSDGGAPGEGLRGVHGGVGPDTRSPCAQGRLTLPGRASTRG